MNDPFLFAPIGNAATRRRVLILALAIPAGCGWIGLHYRNIRLPTRTYRRGFQDFPPLQFVDAQERPYGSPIDLLREAARRADVKLDWVHVPERPDRGLSDGIVDLWPVVNQRSSRLIHQP